METTNQKSIIDTCMHTHTHTHTHKQRTPNITLKTIIKSQEKGTKEKRGKKTYKNNTKQLTKWQ